MIGIKRTCKEAEWDKNMCLRILHVVGIMARGGTETLIMNLYRNMDREKIQFDFVVHGEQQGEYEEEIVAMGGKIFRVPRYRGTNHFAYMSWWKHFLASHTEYSVVHGHVRSTAAFYLNVAKKCGRIAIAHSHNTGSRGSAAAKLVKKVFQYPIRYIADYFFACSVDAGVWLFGRKVCQGARFRVLNNAIDSSKFVFDASVRKEMREALGMDDTCFAVGHVGNFARQKNHSFIIDIFEEIAKRNENSCLLLIGGGDALLQKNIEQKVKEKKLVSKVQFLGSRGDIYKLLNAFDVFLFPSLHEGLGIVAVEAQANGLKCVLSDVIPHEVKVTDNVEFLPLKASPVQWAERILAYRGGYPRVDMKQKIVSSGYDIEATACWLAQFYEKLEIGI